MSTGLPFLSAYDPPRASEGTIDPMGLYQVADRLASELVPAMRERMQRPRFLTPMAVGSFVTAGLETDPEQPQSPPFMVWEWLVVEAILRSFDGGQDLWGVPGTLVTRRAIREHGYLDHRSYLQTARIYGFHGVYKRLAVHLGLVNPDLRPRGPRTEALAEAWSRDMGLGAFDPDGPLLSKWRGAVVRVMSKNPARTQVGWQSDDWQELAEAFAPWLIGRRERRVLREMLLDEQQMRALPVLWKLQDRFDEEQYSDRAILHAMRGERPEYASLIDAIEAYETFARAAENAFDLIRAAATGRDLTGLRLNDMEQDPDFASIADRVPDLCERARQTLAVQGLDVLATFEHRFSPFLEPMSPGRFALEIARHHERIQRGKGDKRPWFDWLEDGEKLYMRANYRVGRPSVDPQRYVHDYRAQPIRLFYQDLQ